MHDDGVFDHRIAATYDEDSSEMFAPEVLGPTVDVLKELAAGKRALEFAVGTGRVAIPLSQRRIDVHGIEMSRAMVEQMMRKPGGDQIETSIGDMATTRVEGPFRLVYLVYGTISNILTEEGQQSCFHNAAAHLEPGGCFVIETGVPDLPRSAEEWPDTLFNVSADHVGYDEYDVANRLLTSHHYRFREGRPSYASSPHRYAWPDEYDEMAAHAGMQLEQRWAGWDKAAFTDESPSHVSVWRLAD